MEIAYIGLGSNVGNMLKNIKEAVYLIGERCRVIQSSNVYESEPLYVTDQAAFYNAAIKVETELDPRRLLQFIKDIEKRMGREDAIRFGPRLIDLDILLYGQAVYEDDALVIPHPRLAERLFVLKPLLDICPGLRHPVSGKTIVEMIDAIRNQRVKRID